MQVPAGMRAVTGGKPCPVCVGRCVVCRGFQQKGGHRVHRVEAALPGRLLETPPTAEFPERCGVGIRSTRAFMDSDLTSRNWVSICKDRWPEWPWAGPPPHSPGRRHPSPRAGPSPEDAGSPLPAASAGAPPGRDGGCFYRNEGTRIVLLVSTNLLCARGVKTGSLRFRV